MMDLITMLVGWSIDCPRICGSLLVCSVYLVSVIGLSSLLVCPPSVLILQSSTDVFSGFRISENVSLTECEKKLVRIYDPRSYVKPVMQRSKTSFFDKLPVADAHVVCHPHCKKKNSFLKGEFISATRGRIEFFSASVYSLAS